MQCFQAKNLTVLQIDSSQFLPLLFKSQDSPRAIDQTRHSLSEDTACIVKQFIELQGEISQQEAPGQTLPSNDICLDSDRLSNT